VPNHPFSLQSLSAAKGSPPSSTDQPGNKKGQPGSSKPPLREQRAQQPPATPRRPVRTDAPAWISQLDTLEHGRLVSKKAGDERQGQALVEEARDEGPKLRELSPAESKDEDQREPVLDVDRLVETPTISSPSVPSGQPVQPPEVELAAKKDDIPAPVAEEAGTQLEAKSHKPPERALHVKVRGQGEPVPPHLEGEEAAGEDSVEDLPTGPLVVEHHESRAQRDALPPPILGVKTPRFEEVTDLDTIPLSAQHQVGFAPLQSEGRAMQAHPHPGDRAIQNAAHTPHYTPIPPASQPASRAAQKALGSTPVLPPQHQVWGQQSPTPAFAPQAGRSRRRPLVLVILLLICLFVL